MQIAMREHRTQLTCAIGLALVLVATTFAYLPALPGEFYFDDNPNIVEAPALH